MAYYECAGYSKADLDKAYNEGYDDGKASFKITYIVGFSNNGSQATYNVTNVISADIAKNLTIDNFYIKLTSFGGGRNMGGDCYVYPSMSYNPSTFILTYKMGDRRCYDTSEQYYEWAYAQGNIYAVYAI